MKKDAGKPQAQIEIVPATRSDEPVLANLLELYIYDFSEILSIDPGSAGRFGYRDLPQYWSDPGRHAFVVRVDGALAGFVLVKQEPSTSGSATIWDMAEFFVLRRHRRRGIGTAVAHTVWKRLPGPWQVRVMETNVPAVRFWQRAVSEFAGTAVHLSRASVQGVPWRIISFRSEAAP